MKRVVTGASSDSGQQPRMKHTLEKKLNGVSHRFRRYAQNEPNLKALFCKINNRYNSSYGSEFNLHLICMSEFFKEPSRRMPRHIKDLNVESARDLNSIRLSDGQTIKKMTRKWPTTHTCLEFTCFILLFRSGYHMAFVD